LRGSFSRQQQRSPQTKSVLLYERFYLVDRVNDILTDDRKTCKKTWKEKGVKPLNSEHSSKFNVCTLAVP